MEKTEVPYDLKKANRRKNGINWFIVMGLTLVIAYYGILFIYPLSLAIIGSLYNWNPLQGTQSYSGFDNYIDLFHNPLFSVSLKNTVIYTTIAVVGRVGLSLLIAIGLVSVRKGRNFLRGTYFLPTIMPMVAVAIIWKWVYHPRAGLLNMFLDMFRIGAQLFLKSPDQALYSVIVMVIWQGLGYSVIIFTAGLLGVSMEQKEAAWLDGANRRQVFKNVIFPGISPTFTFVLITSMIGYFQSFVEIFMLTAGGPGTSTYVISYLIFHEAFKKFNFGYASAISIILFIMISIITVIQLKWLKKGNEE